MTIRSGATFADAAAEFLRYTEQDRGCKPSTLRDYRSNLEAHLLPAFGDQALESITSASIEAWRSSLRALSPRTKNKLLVVMHGVFRRAQHVWSLPANPVATVEKYRQRSSGDINVFSPEEVLALARAATSEQDAAIYLVAAFTGLRRGELLALRWRDVDFGVSVIRVRSSYAAGQLTTPKSGKVRSIPMRPDVAEALARLGQRLDWVGDDDLVFPGETGSDLDGSALRRRYGTALARAGLRLAALPGPPPHLRDTDDRQGRHSSSAGVDGPRRRPDDGALRPLRAASRRRCPRRAGVRRRSSEGRSLRHVLMPRISSFHGIVILMFSNEGAHAVRHFHARYAEHKASIGFDGTLIAGELPPAELRLVRSWAAQHRAELEANWDRARLGQRLEAIDPLA